jgi:3-hydroxyisobutyrate dehydrogenase-like beta-hydroxyacid dehydrogenase
LRPRRLRADRQDPEQHHGDDDGNALSEVLTIGRRAGMDGQELFEALSMGSADSFALRNHGLKSLVPIHIRSRSVEYTTKDASLALELAKQARFDPHIATYTHETLCWTRNADFGQNYHPARIRVVDGRAGNRGD